jgi:hypothetical protein
MSFWDSFVAMKLCTAKSVLGSFLQFYGCIADLWRQRGGWTLSRLVLKQQKTLFLVMKLHLKAWRMGMMLCTLPPISEITDANFCFSPRCVLDEHFLKIKIYVSKYVWAFDVSNTFPCGSGTLVVPYSTQWVLLIIQPNLNP